MLMWFFNPFIHSTNIYSTEKLFSPRYLLTSKCLEYIRKQSIFLTALIELILLRGRQGWTYSYSNIINKRVAGYKLVSAIGK